MAIQVRKKKERVRRGKALWEQSKTAIYPLYTKQLGPFMLRVKKEGGEYKGEAWGPDGEPIPDLGTATSDDLHLCQFMTENLFRNWLGRLARKI